MIKRLKNNRKVRLPLNKNLSDYWIGNQILDQMTIINFLKNSHIIQAQLVRFLTCIVSIVNRLAARFHFFIHQMIISFSNR